MSILDPANLRSFDNADEALDDADEAHRHHRSEVIDKALGTEECRPETRQGDHWQSVDEGDKALGHLVAPQIAEGAPDLGDDYSEDYPDDPPPADQPSDDHAIAEGHADTF